MKRIVITLLVITAIASGFVAGRASADQPRMQAALGHLKLARTELEHADRDKGGHREAALKFTNDAIAEVERGVHYDRHH
jgi:Ni/Co efflux regulator RcnB